MLSECLQGAVPPVRLRTTVLDAVYARIVHIKYPRVAHEVAAAGFLSHYLYGPGAGRSSEVECSLMVRWVIGSILHGVEPLSYFSFQPVLHDWCNKGRGMCYPVCGMVHIKEPLLLIDKSSYVAAAGFLSHYQNGP